MRALYAVENGYTLRRSSAGTARRSPLRGGKQNEFGEVGRPAKYAGIGALVGLAVGRSPAGVAIGAASGFGLSKLLGKKYLK
jgi:hypothetical protein